MLSIKVDPPNNVAKLMAIDVTSGKIAFLLKYFLSIVFLGIPRALAAFT